MSDRAKDIQVVRDLCKQYMEIAMNDRHVRMRQRFRDTNDLKLVRPPLIIEEIPWQQMNYDHALDCVCEDAELRNMEYGLRVALFRDKYFRCDNYIEPFWVVRKAFSNSGNGMHAQDISLACKHTDIRSHRYVDVLEDESALDAFTMPVIKAYPEADERNLAHVREIVGDSIPVVLQGHGIYYAPWDVITRLRGVEPIMIDVYERPEYLHRIIKCFSDAMQAEMDQMEALGLYDPRVVSLHCTPGDVTVPDASTDGAYGCRDIWFRTMAQAFSSISPAAHEEFDMQYSAPLAARCAFTYYGCCEPLHDRIDLLKKNYPNLRKVGCSPWADVERTAEQLGSNYVLSRKPNPAHVAGVTDPALIRKEIEETVSICLKHGCPCDITLKDISTVGDRPENLIEWAQAASEVLDAYYGAD
ncbi:MAG: hypothetical protein MJ192_08170 [Clostridia bacterium]|nr:hypothetical protein [Clostridia bacterium]